MWRWTSVFTTYTHLTVCRVLFLFLLICFYIKALERQSFLTWQPVGILFFLWKCDVLFISYVRPNPTHDIFVIFGGVRICCMQVATFSWQCENQNSQPSCLCFFLLFTYTSQSCEHRRQQRVYECSPLVAANISTVQNILQWTSLQHIPAWRVW